MRHSLDHLRTFLAVYRAGSITGAAQELGLAQPTVTGQIKALEAALGRPLFERQARGVAPTTVADQLARRIGMPMDALAAALEKGGEGDRRTVHIGGPAEFMSEMVLPRLAGPIADGLRLRVTLGMPDPLLDGVDDGRLDLAVLSVRPRRSGLTVSTVYDEEFVLVAAPRWADPAGAPHATPQTLAGVPLVVYAESAPILRRYWRTVFERRLTRDPEVVVPDLRAGLNAVIAGAGATVLPTYLCDREVARGTVRVLVKPEVPPLNTLFLAARQRALVRPEVQGVWETLVRAW